MVGLGGTAAALRGGGRVFAGWSTIPSAEWAAELARAGFGTVLLDMQHGGHDAASVRAGLEAVARAGAAPAVRVPVDAPFEISRALDHGAEIVVVPMVNTADDARRAAALARFPPVGERSWGPAGAMLLHGVADPAAYLADANGATLLLAMIETAAAMANLEAILAVEGVDGVFVGPSDLSISLSAGARLAPAAAETMEAAGRIAAAARSAGKVAGIFTITGEQARQAAELGFGLIALGTDRAAVRAGAAAAIAAASGGGGRPADG